MKAREFYDPRLFGGKFKPEFLQALMQSRMKPIRVMAELEAADKVIRITTDIHITLAFGFHNFVKP